MPPRSDPSVMDTRPACDGAFELSATLTASEQDVARMMQICNACRYCEGFCAVFPAMTRRLDFVYFEQKTAYDL